MMLSSTCSLAALLAAAPLAKAAWLPAQRYVLEDMYAGSDFFDGWTFLDNADPTHGFVQYVNKSTAQHNGLIDASHGPAYIGVDYTHVLDATTSAGRQSIRISTNKTYTEGLNIGDFDHMPWGCGTWPAFWSFSATEAWPAGGEIDIIEGVHTNMDNQATLHTGPTCNISSSYETGTLLTTDCAVVDGNGCSVVDTRNTSYGEGFNNIGGGVYATQWTDQFIRIWFFPRNKGIPWDIQARQPNPSTWGTPMANFEGTCDIPSHFVAHQIVFDTTFCGDWAGNVWENFPTCSALAPTCTDYVASNPSAFRNAYWLINYVAVYQQQSIPGSSTSAAPSTAWPTARPIGYPDPTMIPVAAGQQWGGHWHAQPPVASPTTTAIFAQAPATAVAAAT